MQWLRKAADQTHSAYAMRKLGDAYSDGTLIKPDDQLALLWYTKAAWGGDAPAMVDLGWMYLDGKHISRDYLSAEHGSKEPQTRALPDAALGLGIIYHYGAGVDPDDRLAFSFLQQAAFRGNVEAMRYLGSLYYADHNFTAALSWYRRAAEKGDGFAMENVYVIYQNGSGFPRISLWPRNGWKKRRPPAMKRLLPCLNKKFKSLRRRDGQIPITALPQPARQPPRHQRYRPIRQFRHPMKFWNFQLTPRLEWFAFPSRYMGKPISLWWIPDAR